MKKLIVNITKGDFRNAGAYCDNVGCLLATALLRMGMRGINCGFDRVTTTPGGRWFFSKQSQNKIFRSYSCLSGKPRKDAKPFQIILHPRS